MLFLFCIPENEQWTTWSSWDCDATCGYGTANRHRECQNYGHYPDPKCEKGCEGEAYQTEDCNAGCCDRKLTDSLLLVKHNTVLCIQNVSLR